MKNFVRGENFNCLSLQSIITSLKQSAKGDNFHMSLILDASCSHVNIKSCFPLFAVM